jgi:hypothetical protein
LASEAKPTPVEYTELHSTSLDLIDCGVGGVGVGLRSFSGLVQRIDAVGRYPR